MILAERDLVTAQPNLLTPRPHVKAKVELDRATGQILYNHNVSLEEAFKGVVARPQPDSDTAGG